MTVDASGTPGRHRRTGRHRPGRPATPPRHRAPRQVSFPAARGGIAAGLGAVLALVVTTAGPGTAGTERTLAQRAALAELTLPAQRSVLAPAGQAAARSVQSTLGAAEVAAQATSVAAQARTRSMGAALDLVEQGGAGVRAASEAVQRQRERARSAASRDRDRAARDTGSQPAPSQGQAAAPAPQSYATPVSGPLTSGYGYRWGKLHRGIDYGAGYGAPVRAVGAGTVEMTGWTSGLGYQVRLRLDDGALVVYGHLSRVGVGSGQRLAAGQWLGAVGNSGRSTGPHLHLEVHLGGTAVDPLPWLAARGIAP